MKLLLSLYLLFFSLLFGSNENNSSKHKDLIIISKKTKETNTSILYEETVVKNIVINSINAIVPDFLEVTPKEHFLKVKFNYDIKNKEFSAHVNLRVLLPSLEKTFTSVKATNNFTKYKQKNIKLKISPLLRIYNHIPEIVFHNTLEYNNIFSSKLSFGETIDIYTFNAVIHENTSLSYEKDNILFKINKSLSSEDPGNINYYFGTYYYSDYFKYIRIYGMEIGGEKDLKPFIYYYKLFFTYRHILFNRRYLFLEFSPYILFSKEYEYKFKTFADISINFNF